MAEPPLRTVLGAPRNLDLKALSILLESCPAISLVARVSTIVDASLVCKVQLPDAIILDVDFANYEAFQGAEFLVENRLVRAVAFLDSDESFAHARRAILIPRAAYFTRHDDLRTIVVELKRLAKEGNYEMVGRERISRNDPRHAQLERLDHFGLLTLSAREEEVLCLLVRGLSVKEAAIQIGLSESTVDNHKTRLMKKLNIRRSTHLMRIAMQAGLVE